VRILITGVTGFVGTWLARSLLEENGDAVVWGMARWDSDRSAVGSLPGLRLVSGDLTDGPSLLRVLQESRPDVVYHLAAASTVASSWSTPARILEVNVVGQANLFEAIRALELSPVVVVPCSAEAYGRVDPSRCPLTEEEPFRPVSPYAVSKAAQDLMAYQLHASRGLPVIRMRPFNHTGPGRPDRFVASSFARQLAEMEAGLRPPELHVGNLDAIRDFTDVRDVVRAYRLAAERCTPGGAYNVCSGRPVAVREILEILVSLSTVEPHVMVDPERMRPADIPELWGSAERLHRATGWAPSIPLERTLGDLLEGWRRRLAREAP